MSQVFMRDARQGRPSTEIEKLRPLGLQDQVAQLDCGRVCGSVVCTVGIQFRIRRAISKSYCDKDPPFVET